MAYSTVPNSSNSTVLWGLIIAGILICAAVLGFPHFKDWRFGAPAATAVAADVASGVRGVDLPHVNELVDATTGRQGGEATGSRGFSFGGRDPGVYADGRELVPAETDKDGCYTKRTTFVNEVPDGVIEVVFDSEEAAREYEPGALVQTKGYYSMYFRAATLAADGRYETKVFGMPPILQKLGSSGKTVRLRFGGGIGFVPSPFVPNQSYLVQDP